jgi:hypothetical protein
MARRSSRRRRYGWYCRALALPGALLLGAFLLARTLPARDAAALAAAQDSAAQDPAASVTVNAGSALPPVPPGAIGLNTAVFDGDMTDSAIPGLLKTAGVNALRYPGGSYADIFDWSANTATGGFDAPDTAFDANFIPMAKAVGAQPIVTVNYGTGTPDLAASWVQDADVTNNDGVKYWEVGNEVYGNGFYGAQWEQDNHASKSPDTYASNFLQFRSAMQAVDPNAKVCAVLTTPGFWPDGVVGPGDTMDWNHTVLSILGSNLDCVVVHYYPGGSDTASMLQDPSDISGIMSTLHSEISQYAGSSAPGVQVLVTETNSTLDLDTRPGALFTADMYATWLENGSTNIDYWDEHNGIGTPVTVGGQTDFNDQGIFSNASSGSGVTEPAADTPFAPYYGIEMLTKFVSAGDTPVTSSSDQPLVAAHAVKRADGSLDVLLINKDPSNSYTVSLSYNGFTPSAAAPTVFTLADNATSITSAQQGTTASQTIGPYSLTVIQLTPSSAAATARPLTSDTAFSRLR